MKPFKTSQLKLLIYNNLVTGDFFSLSNCFLNFSHLTNLGSSCFLLTNLWITLQLYPWAMLTCFQFPLLTMFSSRDLFYFLSLESFPNQHLNYLRLNLQASKTLLMQNPSRSLGRLGEHTLWLLWLFHHIVITS